MLLPDIGLNQTQWLVFSGRAADELLKHWQPSREFGVIKISSMHRDVLPFRRHLSPFQQRHSFLFLEEFWDSVQTPWFPFKTFIWSDVLKKQNVSLIFVC